MVHFFLYDYRFERVWKNPDDDIEKLSWYRAVLSPDFSMYLEMAPVMQLYNIFRSRWCGAYWASKGLRVIPTVNWGDKSTFDFCFEGIEKGSVVAVSTYMASEHDNRCDQKEWFMAGYNEMLRRIEPEKIICYNMPFPEMQGNIIYVDYEHSSWRYMNYERGFQKEDLESFKIGGSSYTNYDTIRRNTNMATRVDTNSFEDNRFKTISDFKQCMRRGGEVQFEWNGVLYCCFGCISPAADAMPKMVICQAGSVEVNTRTEKWCDTADEILEYMVGGDRLRDVITQVKVWERTI